MKNLFYFLFGFLSMLLILTLGITHFGDEFIHEYWMDRLYNDLSKPYEYTNIAITLLWSTFAIIYVYNLGKSTSHEEVLIINKEKENEDAYSPSQCDRCDTNSNKN